MTEYLALYLLLTRRLFFRIVFASFSRFVRAIIRPKVDWRGCHFPGWATVALLT